MKINNLNCTFFTIILFSIALNINFITSNGIKKIKTSEDIKKFLVHDSGHCVFQKLRSKVMGLDKCNNLRHSFPGNLFAFFPVIVKGELFTSYKFGSWISIIDETEDGKYSLKGRDDKLRETFQKVQLNKKNFCVIDSRGYMLYTDGKLGEDAQFSFKNMRCGTKGTVFGFITAKQY